MTSIESEPIKKVMNYLAMRPTSSPFSDLYREIVVMMDTYKLFDKIASYDYTTGACSAFTCFLITTLQVFKDNPNKDIIVKTYLSELVKTLSGKKLPNFPLSSCVDCFVLRFIKDTQANDDAIQMNNPVDHLIGTDQFTFKKAQYYVYQNMVNRNNNNCQIVAIAFYSLSNALTNVLFNLDTTVQKLVNDCKDCMTRFESIYYVYDLSHSRLQPPSYYDLYDTPATIYYEFQY